MPSHFYGRSGLNNSAETTASRKTLWWCVGALVVLGVGTGWAFYAFAFLPDPEVVRLEEKSKELFRPPQAGEDPPTPEAMEEKREQFEEFSEEVEQLDESQQNKLFQGFRRMMQEHIRSEVALYHELPPEERVAFLDERIDQMESRRAWGEQRRQQEGAAGDDRPGPPGGGGLGTGADPEERRERMQQFRREFTSDTTPEERAQFAEMFEDLNARREERGLEPMPDFGER